MNDALRTIAGSRRLSRPTTDSKAYVAALIVVLAHQIGEQAPELRDSGNTIIQLVRKLYGRLPSHEEVSRTIMAHLTDTGGDAPDDGRQFSNAADAVLRLLEER
jgi:hypothetical protein